MALSDPCMSDDGENKVIRGKKKIELVINLLSAIVKLRVPSCFWGGSLGKICADHS